MGVHDDHRRRVYERFLREGLAGFEEHNAMEFLLFLARPRGDTNPLAHALIDRFAIDSGRLKSEGKGLTEPAASNDDEAGRALNRRVELVKQS